MKLQETLAWLADFDLDREPPIEAKARLLLLDTVACAAAGFAEPELQSLVLRLAAHGEGRVHWPGMAANLGAADAALAAGAAICWHEACEGLASAHGRPGLHAIATALSLALARGDSLRALLHAIVVGYEVGGRFGQAMRIRPGMHVDGSWGMLGSAAAAAALSGLDSAGIRDAVAIAACQIPTSLYLPIHQGRTARNTYAGHGAAMGLFAAEAAAAGISAPDDEAFLRAAQFVTGRHDETSFSFAEPGHFLIADAYLKPFAAVRHVHYPAACALGWRREHPGQQDRIREIRLRIYPEALTYCGNRAPVTAIQAQFSLSYGTAHALLCGTLGPEAYRPDRLHDPWLRALEQRVILEADPGCTGRGAELVVATEEGESRFAVQSVPGDPDQPLSLQAASDKARSFLAPSLGAGPAQEIIDAITAGDLDQQLRFP